MAASDEEIVVKLDVSKPLGFRLSQPVASNENTSTDVVPLKILKVRRKSQAFKNGLKLGDIITNIDGFTGKLEYSQVMDYLREKEKFTNGQQTVVITLKRGREYGESEPALCITSKQPAATHSTTSSSPTPTSGTNVCCLHGVQSKPGYAKGVVENDASHSAQHKKVESKTTTLPKKHDEDKKKEESTGGALGGLLQFFKLSEPADVSKTDKPVPPAPPAPPKTTTKGDQSNKEQQSWIQRAFQFTEGFTKSSKTEEKAKIFEDKSALVNGMPPSVPYIIKTTSVPPPPPAPSSRFEPADLRYPTFGGSEDSSYSNKSSTLIVRTSTGSSVPYPSPPIAPEVTVGEATVQIHVKPSFKSGHQEYSSSFSTYSRTTTSTDDQSRTEQPAFYTRSTPTFSPKGDTTTVDEQQSVQKRRRQWPPPSNATGVEVVKDIWVGTGSVADLEPSGVSESRFTPVPVPFESSYTETSTTRDYSPNRPSTLPGVVDSTGVEPDELAATVTAAAIRKSKFEEQLQEQVRMCHNIAKALKSPVTSPSKAQRMFTKRKDRMEKWVLASPSSIEEEAASSSESSPSYNTFQPVPTVDTFEVIRSTPQNWYADNYTGSSTATNVYNEVETVPVEHYKKYSRYTYKSTSSYHSAVDDENELHLPKKVRNPMGEVRDYEALTRQYGDDNISTNIASPQKSHELAQALTSDSHAGKGVEMFHRRRQKADDWVVDDTKVTRPTSRSLPPVAPRRHHVDPAEVIESVHEAAARKEGDMFSPSARSRPIYTPSMPPAEAHGAHTSLTELMDGGAIKSPTPPVWGHERLFSPTPFSYSSTPRPYTPIDFGGRRTPLPESHYTDYSSRPDVTTSVVAVSTPSTRIVTTVSQSYTTANSGDSSKRGGFNTLPRSWKSFSSAYKQNY